VVSPDVKEPLEGREGVLYYLDLGSTAEAGGRQDKRLGGSALAQALGVEEDQGPDVTDVHRLRQGLEAVQVRQSFNQQKGPLFNRAAMAG
jgi:phosphoribosylformylglycinamidine (FGAM) synthase-like enzyme